MSGQEEWVAHDLDTFSISCHFFLGVIYHQKCLVALLDACVSFALCTCLQITRITHEWATTLDTQRIILFPLPGTLIGTGDGWWNLLSGKRWGRSALDSLGRCLWSCGIGIVIAPITFASHIDGADQFGNNCCSYYHTSIISHSVIKSWNFLINLAQKYLYSIIIVGWCWIRISGQNCATAREKSWSMRLAQKTKEKTKEKNWSFIVPDQVGWNGACQPWPAMFMQIHRYRTISPEQTPAAKGHNDFLEHFTLGTRQTKNGMSAQSMQLGCLGTYPASLRTYIYSLLFNLVEPPIQARVTSIPHAVHARILLMHGFRKTHKGMYHLVGRNPRQRSYGPTMSTLHMCICTRSDSRGYELAPTTMTRSQIRDYILDHVFYIGM